MGYRWKQSKSKAIEFANQMDDIKVFCSENGITQSFNGDSYYFSHEGKSYRISNHTVSKSDSGMSDFLGNKLRDSYHINGYDVEITAGKTRIIEIYNAVKMGKTLNKRGYEVQKWNIEQNIQTK